MKNLLKIILLIASFNLGAQIVNDAPIQHLEGAQFTNATQVTTADSIPYSRFYTDYTNNGFFSENDVIQVQSVYNVVDFERYEFSFAALLLSGHYYIKVETIDTNFTDKSFTSEWLWVQETHKKHIRNTI